MMVFANHLLACNLCEQSDNFSVGQKDSQTKVLSRQINTILTMFKATHP